MPDPVLEAWDKHEKENQSQTRDAMRRLEYETETNPRRKCLHSHVVTVSAIAGLSLFVMGIGQFVGFVLNEMGPISYVLRIYVIVLCSLGILAELEWTALGNSTILKIWITRGLFYGFIGVLGLQQNDTASLRDQNRPGDHVAVVFTKVVAWIMIGVGALYFVMGITCMQIIYNRQREDYTTRKERAGIVRETTSRYGGDTPDVV